jgi:hypothetical protein
MEEGLEASSANSGWKAARCLPKDMQIWYVAAVAVVVGVDHRP